MMHTPATLRGSAKRVVLSLHYELWLACSLVIEVWIAIGGLFSVQETFPLDDLLIPEAHCFDKIDLRNATTRAVRHAYSDISEADVPLSCTLVSLPRLLSRYAST